MRVAVAITVSTFVILGAFATTTEASGRLEDKGRVGSENILPGHSNPPGPGSSDWTNPCPKQPKPIDPADVLEGDDPPPDPEPTHSEWGSEATGLVKNEAERTATTVDGEPQKHDLKAREGGRLDGQFDIVSSFDQTFNIEYVRWRTGCRLPGAGAWDRSTINFYWVRRPTPESVVNDLIAEVIADLDAPYVQWPTRDPEFGWVYVNVDSDLRITPVDSVSATDTVTNVTGSATATVTATPSTVTFASNEPGGGYTECTYAQITAAYLPDRATGCTYRFRSSSSVSPNELFRVTTTLTWNVTATPFVTVSDPVSSTSENIAVASVQSLVTDT